ncbi:Phosphoribosylformylglycinamidine synthase subunit PurL [Phycisphaerales bacterium]|nr:Phosphoribosylformylglycinamidine synthase subunit PurL [Phycisphaerales bacterium]
MARAIDLACPRLPASPALISLRVSNSPTVVRIEVRTRPGVLDPRAQAVKVKAIALGYPVREAATAKVYLIEGLPDQAACERVVGALLADPVVEIATIGSAKPAGAVVEVLPLPGVMDVAAQSVRAAVRDLTGAEGGVLTGVRYDFEGLTARQAEELARRILANPVVHQIRTGPFQPDSLPKGHEYSFQLRTAPLRGLDDEALLKFSREAHLFMSLPELRAVAEHFETLGRDPTDIELETIAQTWSEHCVHKTLKSTVVYRETVKPPEAAESAKPQAKPKSGMRRDGISFEFTPTGRAEESTQNESDETVGGEESDEAQPRDGIAWAGRPGHMVNEDGSVTIENLLKSTVAAATFELIREGVDWTLSVFKDNSGIVALDDQHGVCIKVETHNRPSAIEPYGGSATGVGGCIRDVIGTGLGARPIANMDVFCVAEPGTWREAADPPAQPSARKLPPGTLHPRRILTDVVSGVRDYGNRMGIPTVNGAVYFDDRYVGNPLVFCGCVGLIPRGLVEGRARDGDIIVALGGRTGRDGIHGATFSSAELEQTHADEFSHAVQIGNAIEEKRVLDAILRARSAGEDGAPLYSAMTDCGAGGFSSAVGEMGKDLGAEVHLDRAPLKYRGLSYTEIWISEAQERMVLAVSPRNLEALQAICDEEHVELSELGEFGTPERDLVLCFQGREVGRLSMEFLHDGLPMPTKEARWEAPNSKSQTANRNSGGEVPVGEALTGLLGHPNIASKHWIIRQYDHEVQGNTIVKPLTGPGGRGPSDASVLEPVAGTGRGIAIACGLNPGIGDSGLGGDPYQMALAGIDECVRNLVCVGADPRRIAILDNFCWPSCEAPENMGALVRACAGCYDGAKAYRTPFVSGKDSLNNQLRYQDPATGEQRVIEIPCTLLISGLGIVRNIARCVTMDAKRPGNALLLIGETGGAMGGSHYQRLFGTPAGRDDAWSAVPRVDLKAGPATAQAVSQMIGDGLVLAAHDCSDGGLLPAVAEMLIATTGDESDKHASTESSALANLLAAKAAPLRALGAELTLADDLLEPEQLAFAETPSRYVIEIKPEDLPKVKNVLRDFGGIAFRQIGKLNASGRLVWRALDVDADVGELGRAWLAPLDW